jgi:hypothetical protein
VIWATPIDGQRLRRSTAFSVRSAESLLITAANALRLTVLAGQSGERLRLRCGAVRYEVVVDSHARVSRLRQADVLASREPK